MKVKNLIKHCSAWGDDRIITLKMEARNDCNITAGEAMAIFGDNDVLWFDCYSITLKPKGFFKLKDYVKEHRTDLGCGLFDVKLAGNDGITLIYNALLTMDDAVEIFGNYEFLNKEGYEILIKE